MRYANLPSGAAREVEVGLVWREVYNGAGGTSFRVKIQSTIRVSAAASVAVTIDGVLAITLRAGEVERINVGAGAAGDERSTVLVEIGPGDARVQLAEDIDPGRRSR